MAQKYGTLELKEKQGENGTVRAFIGKINVPDIIAGVLAIGEDPNAKPDAKMTHIVKINTGKGFASVGRAGFTRKNSRSNWYLNMVLESPVINSANNGKPLWLRGFTQDAEDCGERPNSDKYDLIWGSGGQSSSGANQAVEIDDEIPFE